MEVGRVPYAIDGWGIGELWVEDRRVVWHELPRPRPGPPQSTTRGERSERSVTRGKPDSEQSAEIVTRLKAYFAGCVVDLADVELDLAWCTQYQRAVADALGGVPYGETVTYGELAALAGYPNANRAAGSFCARNRFPLFLPCHRVVSAAGIGSYGSLGTGYKRRLLALEAGSPPRASRLGRHAGPL